tara:strand:+ start:829 stop:1089 length:261 start_codon:yes stop_codon:yes gene_type:complete
MATKKAPAKKAPENKPAEKKATGRPPKLGEVTEMDLGEAYTEQVHLAARAHGVDTGVIVRAMVRKQAKDLIKKGPIATQIALQKFM